MNVNILDKHGKDKGKMDLPKCFSSEVREDIVMRVLEVKKNKQPYGPSPIAGNQSSASGSLVHRRHVWKSQYGRGMSRIPRKTMSRRGSQFNWVGAVVPSARGGRRAHPPKVISMINTRRVNKKEMKIALCSALSASVNPSYVTRRYLTLNDKKIENLPLIVSSDFVSLKVKEVLSVLKDVLGKDLFSVAIKKRSVRSGKGKLRGRKYKSNAGLLFVVGKKEKFKTTAFDVVNADKVGVTELAKGGLGRVVLYTEGAVKHLGDKLE